MQENPKVKDIARADELLRTFDLKQPVYTLQPGDVLSLKVQSTTPTEYNFLSTGVSTFGATDPVLDGYTLDAEGNMVLPVIGKVNLNGLSMPEARIKVTEALKPYLTEPTVNLRLLTFRYTVIGEGGGQGQFTTYQDNINVLEAIANAGGFSPYSDRASIKLIRYENGQAKLYKFSVLDDNVLAMSNFYLKPNDTIVIDPLPAKYVQENLLANIGLTLSLIATLTVLIDRFLR
ncbi:polysaccharide biosynthesis/export family protein [Pontibacter cellulosilyticus]|uniref:Polysaccharide biosynthesis/export family protein n=1 Tax=Pontibacter cellulosilyticus TaxID=1720253 RepID=A0A923N3K0_9BACT|nr:polysaccharide biosynthesis/export family protein [Pontibacter cellulosilyticus]MBC5991596.1 polysaccharide biosynthesis/export family protein [Pontibacter cellulosilyticus]